MVLKFSSFSVAVFLIYSPHDSPSSPLSSWAPCLKVSKPSQTCQASRAKQTAQNTIYDFWWFLLQASCKNLMFFNSSSKFQVYFLEEENWQRIKQKTSCFLGIKAKRSVCIIILILILRILGWCNRMKLKLWNWKSLNNIIFFNIDLDQFRFSKVIDKEYVYFCLKLLIYTGFAHPKVLALGHCCTMFCTI